MQEKFEKLSQMISEEFQDHIDQVIGLINNDKDIENAIKEAIEVRIGQVHNRFIWNELAARYAEMIHNKLDNKGSECCQAAGGNKINR